MDGILVPMNENVRAAASRPSGRDLIVYANGEADLRGIDYGGKLTLVAVNKHAIVLHCTGHTRWAGRGMQAYEPAKDLVYSRLGEASTDERGNVTYSVAGLIEIPRGRKQ